MIVGLVAKLEIGRLGYQEEQQPGILRHSLKVLSTGTVFPFQRGLRSTFKTFQLIESGSPLLKVNW